MNINETMHSQNERKNINPQIQMGTISIMAWDAGNHCFLGKTGHSNQESRTINIQRFQKNQSQKTMLTSTTVRQKSRGNGPSKWRVMIPRSEIAESEVNRMSMGQMHFYKFTVAISLQPQTSSQHLHLHEPPQQKYLSQPPKFTQSVLSLQNKKPNQKSLANLPVVDPKTYQNPATWQPHNTQKTPVHHRSWTWPKDLPHPCRKPRSKMPPETFSPLGGDCLFGGVASMVDCLWVWELKSDGLMSQIFQ